MTTAALSLDDHVAGLLTHARFLASGRYCPTARPAALPIWPSLPAPVAYPLLRAAKSVTVAAATLVVATHLMNIAWFVGGQPARPTLAPVVTQTIGSPRPPPI